MPGRHKIRREQGLDYEPLFRRLEEKFSPEEMTAQAIKDFISAKTEGMDALAEQLAQVSVISDIIEESTDLVELRGIYSDIEKLEVHQQALFTELDERIIAVSILTAEELARQKNIVLSEKVRGGVEEWGTEKKEKIVIRDSRGRFVSWKNI